MDLGIAGKTALVCASSRGLGLACATALAREGGHVYLNGRTSEALRAAADQIEVAGGKRPGIIVADLNTEEGRAAVADACPEPDILVNNNAGPEPGKIEDWQKTGANYAMYAPSKLVSKPIGQYNHSRIIFNKGQVEHWLNGVRIVKFTAWSPEWEKLKSTGKWKDYPDYAKAKSGHIAFQGDHGCGIWFKNIKLLNIEH